MVDIRTLGKALEIIILVTVVILIAGQLLGQPILLAFVETGSMQPALNAGDGFVAIPIQVEGSIEQGDVVVFEAEEIQGGGLTTHRVVGQRDSGFITKGDNNPYTDQSSGEPPVKNAQIVAVAWQPGGTVFVIPRLGLAVKGVQSALETVQRQLAAFFGTRSLLGFQGIPYLVFGISVIWFLVAEYNDRGMNRIRGRTRNRKSGQNIHLLIVGMAILIMLGATAAMVVPSGTQKFGVVSSESDSPGVRVIAKGESESINYSVGNSGVLPVIVYLEPASEGVKVETSELTVPRNSVKNTTLTLSVPPKTGYYHRFLVEYRYLAVLPPSHIKTLHGIHPSLPVVVIDAFLGLPFYFVSLLVFPRGRVRRRNSDRPSKLDRLLSRLT